MASATVHNTTISVLHLRRRNSRFNLFIRTNMAADYADSAAHSMRHFMRQIWLPACAPDSDPPAFDGLEETAFIEPRTTAIEIPGNRLVGVCAVPCCGVRVFGTDCSLD